jgi:hypothetical protein
MLPLLFSLDRLQVLTVSAFVRLPIAIAPLTHSRRSQTAAALKSGAARPISPVGKPSGISTLNVNRKFGFHCRYAANRQHGGLRKDRCRDDY